MGVIIPDHVTPQAQHAISRCSQIYAIVQEPSALWIPKGKLGQIKVINALDYYTDGGIRADNYERVAREIIGAASAGNAVGYVTYGNPMSYDRVAQNLVLYAEEAGVVAQVVPGISSLDTIMCDLRLDMAPAIQVFEASWIYICQTEPHTDVPMLLLQVGTFGSLRAHYGSRRDGSSIVELADYLCRYYPRTHSVSLVRSTAAKDQPACVRQVTLENLKNVSAEDLSGASMFIPASRQTNPDPEIFRRMEQN